AGALQQLASGLKELLQLDYHAAGAAFQRAQVRMGGIVQRLSKIDKSEKNPVLAVLLSGIQRDLLTSSVLFLTSSYYEYRADGSYSAAVDSASKRTQILEQIVDGSPDEPRWLRPLSELQLHLSLADLEFAKAHLYKS